MIDKSNLRFLLENPKDYIQQFLRNQQFYEEEELLYLKSLNTKKWNILDIGANIGNHTVFFSKFMDVDTVYVIEPLEEAYKSLLCNVALNYCHNVNLDYIGLALSDKQTNCSIKEKYSENLGNTLLKEDVNGIIPCVTGDMLFKDKSIDLIKLDVEQMEIKVLNGLKETINKSRPLIFLELDVSNQQDLMNWIKENSYTLIGQVGVYNNFLLAPNENSGLYNLQKRN